MLCKELDTTKWLNNSSNLHSSNSLSSPHALNLYNFPFSLYRLMIISSSPGSSPYFLLIYFKGNCTMLQNKQPPAWYDITFTSLENEVRTSQEGGGHFRNAAYHTEAFIFCILWESFRNKEKWHRRWHLLRIRRPWVRRKIPVNKQEIFKLHWWILCNYQWNETTGQAQMISQGRKEEREKKKEPHTEFC